MIIKLIFPVVLVLALLFNCTDNDRPTELPNQEQKTGKDTLNLDSTFQHCDSVSIATSIGTACCVSGPMVAKPGDILQYHYQINHSDANVSWQILNGDISIIAGQNTQTITVQFGANFTTGIVFGDGNGVPTSTPSRQRCTDRVIVTSN
jgi:hypothetical protein